jgi:hypothetical protein
VAINLWVSLLITPDAIRPLRGEEPAASVLTTAVSSGGLFTADRAAQAVQNAGDKKTSYCSPHETEGLSAQSRSLSVRVEPVPTLDVNSAGGYVSSFMVIDGLVLALT